MSLHTYITRYLVLICSAIIILSGEVRAGHQMGGEITWKCNGAGAFIFQMKLYRDCNSVSFNNTLNLNVFNHPTVTQIPVNLVTQTDISPVCNAAGPAITCSSPGPGAVEEFIFQSNPVVLTGTPPAAGWIFSYISCCRNASITSVNNGNTVGITLRAVMYAYNNMNASPCYDNSPEFLEPPSSILCAGNPFSYNQNAVDAELDSLAYSWAEPLGDTMGNTWNPPFSPAYLPYVAGFSATSPLPGPAMNPGNIPATIDPITGEISFTSFTSGNFVTCIKVEAWKCGQLVAEIYREMQVIILACAGNNAQPAIAPPLNSNTTYADTVYAGQIVNFTLTASDPDLQTLTLTASGNQFGTGFTSTTAGCLNPPCATLTPPPPVSGPGGNVQTTFNWQTSCSHIAMGNSCYVGSNTYNFVFRVQDDFCPAPSADIKTISITVLSIPPVLSPNVHCVAVQPNGDVVLTWDQPVDTAGTFNSYHIFSSTNPNGPFTVVDSIFNINQLTYTHAGANANNGPVYYLVQTRAGCNGMQYWAPIDTMSSIFLQVINNNNGTASLNWNNISNPAPGSQAGQFYIYREYPVGNWVLLDSTSQLFYLDSISVCSSQVNYRIEIYDTLGCWSMSNMDGDLFQDPSIPAIPSIDSVSVDVNGNAIIGWQSSTVSDVVGYVVYQYINGIWTAVDTLYGVNSTSLTNLISNADQQAEQYVIAAFDSCGNISAFSSIHQTIYLSSWANICNAATYLTWNRYINMNPSLGGYTVYVSENGGPYTVLGSTSAGDTTFVHSGLAPLSTFCYYVVAFNGPGTISSTSNETCIFSGVPQQPAYQYLRAVTVNNPDQVKLTAYVDITADIQGYNVMRADSVSGPFDLIGFIPFTSQPNVVYYDNTAETERQSYYYKVVAVDSCGSPSVSSNVSRTIYCEATPNNELSNTISWNDYESWLGTVSYYNIYRTIDGVTDPVPIATVPYTAADSNFYVDDVSLYAPGSVGMFTYRIEAVEGPGNIYSLTDTSYSNVAEAAQLPLVFVPNAFTPNANGLNDEFMPSTGFIDITDYQFFVFDRWGEKIFSTTDRYEGWDGRMGDNKCEGGIYVWSLTFKTATGQYIDMVGTVALIR